MPLKIQKLFTINNHEAPVYCLENFNDDSFFSGGGDKIVCAQKLKEGSASAGIVKTGSTIYSLYYLRNKNILLAGVSHGGLHVIDLLLKKEIHFLLFHQNGIFDIKYSAHHDIIITAGGDGKISFFSASDFTFLKSLTLCTEKIRSLAINKNGNEIAAGCGDGSICILDPKKMELAHRFKAHQSSVNVVLYHPHQDVLLSGGKDAHLHFWRGKDFVLHYSVPAHNYAIYSIGFSPSSELFATGSRDKTIKIWDGVTFDFMARIDQGNNLGHLHSVNKLLWVKDILLTTGDDKKILGWDISRSK